MDTTMLAKKILQITKHGYYEEQVEKIAQLLNSITSASNGAKPIVSGSLPPFPDWNEAIKGIDDSRFTTLDGRYEVSEGARIMYDRLYSMLTRRQ